MGFIWDNRTDDSYWTTSAGGYGTWIASAGHWLSEDWMGSAQRIYLLPIGSWYDAYRPTHLKIDYDQIGAPPDTFTLWNQDYDSQIMFEFDPPSGSPFSLSFPSSASGDDIGWLELHDVTPAWTVSSIEFGSFSSSSQSSSSTSSSSLSSSSNSSSSSSTSVSSSSISNSSSSSSSSTSMTVPSLKHFWYTLRDQAGEPREGETVYAYEAESTILLDLYDHIGRPIANPMTTSTGTSGVSAGIFEFYLKDLMWNNESPSGYAWNDRIKLQWDHDGSTKYADRIMTWGDFYPVYRIDGEVTSQEAAFDPLDFSSITPPLNSDVDYNDKNKAVSNSLACKVESHRVADLGAFLSSGLRITEDEIVRILENGVERIIE